MPIKVLIIDNETQSHSYLSEIFQDKTFQVNIVSDSAAALELLSPQKQTYTLIVASKSALGDEPESFSLSVRTNPAYIHTPIILITPENSKADATYYAVGFTQVYSKLEMGNFKQYVDLRIQERATAEKMSYNVLVIEDDYSQQLIIRSILEANRGTVVCVDSAEEALQQKAFDADIILVDIFLAGKMTGIEFIMEINKPFHPWFKVPILALTGLDDPARKYECLRAGANDYLIKPLQDIDLTVRVENLLKYKRLLDTVDKQNQEMQYLAMHDQLTGLNNRHFMVSQASKRIKEASRHDIPLSLIMLDIDHFKRVNDTLGHDAGDVVLKGVANILEEQCRDEDIVIRLGGEEFLLLLGYCDLESALLKADILRRCIESSTFGATNITASFGVAQLSKSLNDFDRLFKSADDAVYKAKHHGRNRVEKGGNEAI